jgi:dTDP-4-amino-4,6-dideoxygalactose transaminase
LVEKLSGIPCFEFAKNRPGAIHAYYLHVMKYNAGIAGVSRAVFLKALQAELPFTELRETEGVKVSAGYVKPIYLQPMFHQKIAFGSKGHPWTTFNNLPDYSKGSCPVTEDLHFNTLMAHELMRPPMTKADLDDVAAAFWKVWEHRDELKSLN